METEVFDYVQLYPLSSDGTQRHLTRGVIRGDIPPMLRWYPGSSNKSTSSQSVEPNRTDSPEIDEELSEKLKLFEEYGRREWDYSIGRMELEKQCPLDNGRCTNIPVHGRYSLGQLDELPAELVLKVLSHFDLPTLTKFRCVNQRARNVVDEVPEYKAIIQHCPNILRAIISINADAFDCATLFATLCTSKCSNCRKFGEYIYLFTCRRVCYWCFTTRPEYLPLMHSQVLQCKFPSVSTLQDEDVTKSQRLESANLPTIFSLPGKYSCSMVNKHSLRYERIQLFDRQAIENSGFVFSPPRRDRGIQESRRFMGVIPAPYSTDAGRTADWGYKCPVCTSWAGNEVIYDKQAALKHMELAGLQRISRLPLRFCHKSPAPKHEDYMIDMD